MNRPLVRRLLLVAAAVAFAVAYGQAPLYHSNQNQYFLHGLAHAGVGHLDEDWLANTADPTPVFSGLVTVVDRTMPTWTFHVIHGLLVGGYLLALYRIFVRIVGPELAANRAALFLALVALVHSALARWLSYRLFGLDYPWYFQAGVASQYVLGGMLQPSVFGVLLLGAVALFADDRPWFAALAIAAAATVHATYLLPGALLTVGFIVQLLRERRPGRAVSFGGLTLLLVVPVTIWTVITLRARRRARSSRRRRTSSSTSASRTIRDPISGWIRSPSCRSRGSPSASRPRCAHGSACRSRSPSSSASA